MKSIEEIAFETYNENLIYFEKEHKELFNQLLIFNTLLENNPSVAKYDLDYLEGYFDVKELSSGYHLYSGNSQHISEKFTKDVNYKKDSFVFDGFPIFYYSKQRQDNLTDNEEGYEGLLPIMSYYIDNTSVDNDMISIDNYMFLGVALGLHLPLIHKKIKASHYLIIEDDMELFRLSLFTTQYYMLGQKAKLFFAIAYDSVEFSKVFSSYLDSTWQKNRYIKYAHFPTHTNRKIKDIQHTLSSRDFIVFPYKTLLKNYIRPLEFMGDGYSVLNLSKCMKNSLFDSKPAILLAAGPSFQKNLQFVKENHQKFIIIAITAVLKTLQAENIKPDIVVHIDGFVTSLVHLKEIDKEFIKDCIAVLSPISPAALRDIFKKEHTFYYQTQTNYVEGFDTVSTPCVGSLSLLFSLLFGIKVTYVLGLDLALDQKTGATHSSDHAFGANVDLSKTEFSPIMGIRKNIISVDGNFSKKVYTTSLFNTSIKALNKHIVGIKQKEQKVFNLSNGALFDKTEPLDISKIKIEQFTSVDKVKLKEEILSVFLSESTKKLSTKEIHSIEQRLLSVKARKKRILKYKNKVSYTKRAKYLKNLDELMLDALLLNTSESINLTMIYNSFIKFAIPLLRDLLNSKNLRDEKKHLIAIDRLMVSELLCIADIYEDALSKFMKKVNNKKL